MANAPQGGLSQASAQPPAGGGKAPAFDADTIAAENIETQNKETPAKDYATRALEERREQSKLLNLQIEMLKANLESRMNPPFDPVLMRVSAGFGKPTKTGSFGESLGYASEGAADESDKQLARNAMVDKMRMELMEKQQGLNQQNLMADYHASRLGILPSGVKPSGAPAGGASVLPSGAPSESSPAGGPPSGATPNALKFQAGQIPSSGGAPAGRAGPTGGAMEMKPITDRDIADANFIDPSGKLAKDLMEQAKLQREDIIMIDGKPYLKSQRQFLEGNPDTQIERNFGRYVGTIKVPYWFSKQYDAVKAEAERTNNPDMVFEFFKKYDMLEPTKTKDASGKPTYESLDDKKHREEIIQKRLEAQIGEEKGSITMMETNARLGRDTVNIARDIRATAESNKTAFDLLNNPGIADAVKRASERGITFGSLGNFSIPTRELETYKLSGDDRQALQLLAQKMSQLTAQFRKSARAPGEGATTESEGRLYAELGALPSDTAAVIRLKMEALEEKAKFDQAVFRTWSKYSKDPSNTYRDFLASGYEEGSELNKVMGNYDARLEKIRRSNADLFRTTPKPAAPAANTPAPAAPPATPPAASPKPAPAPAPAPVVPAMPPPAGGPVAAPTDVPAEEGPKNESYSDRLKRLQKQRGG